MNIDPVVYKAARIEDLRRAAFEAEDRHDYAETERLGNLLTAVEADERDTSPTTPHGVAEKLRLIADYAGIDPHPQAQAIAKALPRLARDMEQSGPRWSHVSSIEGWLLSALLIPGGETTGMITQVVPRFEALLRWVRSPGLMAPPTASRLQAGASETPGRGGKQGPSARAKREWRPWLSIVPATEPPPQAQSAMDRPPRTGCPLRLVHGAQA